MSFAAGGFSLDHRNCQHMANGSEGTDNEFTNDVYLEVVMLTGRKKPAVCGVWWYGDCSEYKNHLARSGRATPGSIFTS